MIKAVIFDLDDTLYPESDYVVSGFNKVAKAMNCKYHTTIYGSELYDLFLQDNANVYNRVLDKHHIIYTAQDITYFINVYRTNKPVKKELNLYDGVRHVLEDLHKDYKLGIITDGRVDGQKAKVYSLDIEKYFDKIIYSDRFGIEHIKPDVLPFKMMKEALSIEYSEMIYIGDNRAKDFAVSSKIDIKTIEVLNLYKIHNNAEYLDSVKPTYILEEIDELSNFIRSINND